MTAAIVLAAAGLVSCAPPPSPVDLGGANLLLITVDTLRTDRVGAFGDADASTPHIDALAEGGVKFVNAYAPVPLTLPSHSSLFTGRYPFDLQVRTNGSYFLHADELTLAERLAANGYTTAAFVSTYILGSKFGLDQGFDHYDDRLSTGDVIHSFTSEVSADHVVSRFEAWFAEEKPERFFAWLHFYDPHLPYDPPEPFADRFADDAYRGEIAFVDSQIGRALTVLDTHGARDETLVVVTSDHGESFGEHGETGHGILAYDEALRVPLLFNAGNRLEGGTTIEQRARLIDLAPTMLEMLGLAAPGDVPGKSLLPMIERSSHHDDREVYFESLLGAEDYNWAPIIGLIGGSYKYISLPQPELYDLENDPGERKNIYRSHTAVADELDQRLRELLLSAGESRDDSRRELSEEDLSHLQALGYLGAAERSASVIDPKQGIRIDQELKRTRALLESGKLAEAGAAARVLADDPDNAGLAALYALRHEIAIHQQDPAKAIAVLEAGIEELPDSERLRLLLANYLFRVGRTTEAADAAEALLSLKQDHTQALIILGQIAEAAGSLPQAISYYDRALLGEPGSLDLRRRRAEALLASGDSQLAATELAELADLGAFDHEPEQLYRLGVLMSRTGDHQRAEQLFRQGLARAPGGVHHVTFALLLLQRQESSEARRHLQIALTEYSGDLTAEQRALARATLEQLEAAGNS